MPNTNSAKPLPDNCHKIANQRADYYSKMQNLLIWGTLPGSCISREMPARGLLLPKSWGLVPCFTNLAPAFQVSGSLFPAPTIAFPPFYYCRTIAVTGIISKKILDALGRVYEQNILDTRNRNHSPPRCLKKSWTLSNLSKHAPFAKGYTRRLPANHHCERTGSVLKRRKHGEIYKRGCSCYSLPFQ